MSTDTTDVVFSHRDDPSRTATLRPTDARAAAYVVEHTDAAGTRRKKTFRNANPGLSYDAALRFLLNKEGYIVRAPQTGAVRWMARILQNYYGDIGHAVDPRSGAVWVADACDGVHRIEPGTCATTVVALRSGHTSPGGSAAAGLDGSAWVLAPTWVRVDGTLVRQFRLVRVTPQGDALAVEEVVRATGPEALASVASDHSGRALGPCEGGAALYGADGGVVQRWSLQATDKLSPVGALSANGEWVALAGPERVVRIELRTGQETVLAAGVETLEGVQVTDDGTVYLSGFRYPYHALWRLSQGEPERVSTDTRAVVRADGALLVEASRRRLALCDLRDARTEAGLPAVVAQAALAVLGTAKYGRALFCGVGDELVVLTDAYTVASVVLEREA